MVLWLLVFDNATKPNAGRVEYILWRGLKRIGQQLIPSGVFQNRICVHDVFGEEQYRSSSAHHHQYTITTTMPQVILGRMLPTPA